ncbi:PEP-CTERM sorting domain-containing protein [Gloeothece verrucosa]
MVNAALLIDTINVTSVPEPLTILGSGIALGFRFYFKGKMNKN